MEKFLKRIVKSWRKLAVRSAMVVAVLMSLAALYSDNPEGGLAWLLGILTGAFVTLLWINEEDLTDEEEAEIYEQDE